MKNAAWKSTLNNQNKQIKYNTVGVKKEIKDLAKERRKTRR